MHLENYRSQELMITEGSYQNLTSVLYCKYMEKCKYYGNSCPQLAGNNYSSLTDSMQITFTVGKIIYCSIYNTLIELAVGLICIHVIVYNSQDKLANVL